MKAAAGFLAAMAALTALGGCGREVMPEKGPCDDLVFDESGPAREAYLPCAGAIIAAMDALEPLVETSLDGDKETRKAARRAYRTLRKLVKKTGRKGSQDAWRDHRLGDLKESIDNAYAHYWACTRSPNLREFESAEQYHDEARRRYDRLN